MNYQIENIIIIYGIVILHFLITIIWREYTKSDIKLYRNKIIFGLDGWALLHFINYLALGYLSPNYIIHVLLIGIIFEFLELPLGKYVSTYINSKIYMDAIVNSVGGLTGYLLYKKYPNKIELMKCL
jgi:hypothetical protein